jgi:hypothetical protein
MVCIRTTLLHFLIIVFVACKKNKNYSRKSNSIKTTILYDTVSSTDVNKNWIKIIIYGLKHPNYH